MTLFAYKRDSFILLFVFTERNCK